MEYGLYIHLPYCRSLCPYCDFVKAPLHRAEPDRLLRALEREWELAREAGGAAWSAPEGGAVPGSPQPSPPPARPRTIYLGGGTPTALPLDSLGRLLDWIGRAWDTRRVREFTAEANPEGLTREKLDTLRAAGVNRLSLGVQSLEPRVLRFLGRIHSAEDALDAIERARVAGFSNLSVDLMYGVPGETAAGFHGALERLAALGVPHVSAYPLQVEEGTPLHAKVERGTVEVPGEEWVAARYADLADRLGRAGYEHYEVSNFALPGMRSRHNEGYWIRRPYLGLGPGAHSFDRDARWGNEDSITRYFQRVEAGELPRRERHQVSERGAIEEGIFLSLRRSRGLRETRHLESLRADPLDAWKSWGRSGGALITGPPGRVRPTERGLFLAHELAAELLAGEAESRAPAPA